MKIGVSDYSFRHDFAKKTKNYVDDFPAYVSSIGIQGIECIDGSLEQNLPDIELEDIKKFQEHLKSNYNLDICAITGFRLLGWGFGAVWEEFKLDNIISTLGMNTEMLLEWVEICGELGIPNIRFDAGGFQASHKVPIYKAIDLNIEIYSRVLIPACERAKEVGVKIGVENHGYFTADIKVLTKLLDKVPGLCVTCDTGNWPFESRLDDIKAISGRINFFHAKTHVFDDDGLEKNIDFKAIVEIMNDAGFDGWWSIEWEGPSISDEEGVKKSYDLLKRYE
ncbi:MAG: sugar phosphate isomerase/epimerase family protein [Candidatus Hodarchaeota archaeon]